ncbi:hypothetical protein ACFLSX_03325, partial [Calditrichota bacterium]
MRCTSTDNVVTDYSDIDLVKTQIEKFVPVEISYDESILNDSQKQVLAKLVEAGKYMDKIFLRQVYHKNEQLKDVLSTGNNPDYKTLFDFFSINFG